VPPHVRFTWLAVALTWCFTSILTESVSPILHSTRDGHFHEYIGRVWGCARGTCLIEETYCGTHVCLSPNNKFTAVQIKALVHATPYFKPAINRDILMPPDRLGNEYDKSFFSRDRGSREELWDRPLQGWYQDFLSHAMLSPFT
jgi:hypothetical protein